MLSIFRNLIKRAHITRVSKDNGFYSNGQISYYGKAANSEYIWPYGYAANPPIDSLCITFSVNGQEENRSSMPYEPLTRFKNLKSGEIKLGNQLKGIWIYFREDGKIEINADQDVIVNGNLLTSGNITDNSGTQSATLKDLRDAYNAHTHISNGAGNPTSTTDTPV